MDIDTDLCYRSSMQYFTENKPRSIFWILALAGTCLAVGATTITDFDLWWHLKTGEIIWLWRQIPKFDIFSYTASGNAWVNHEWLFQIVTWLLYSKIGVGALVCLKLSITILLTVCLFKTFEFLTNSKSAALWGCLIVIYGSADRVLERPHLFSLFFIAFYCLSLHRFSRNLTKTLWVIPIIQVLWSNIHGGAIFGCELIIAFTIGETIQYFFSGPTPLAKNKLHHLWTISAASVLALCINPSGIDILFFSASHLNMQAILENTQEWLPVLDPRFDGIIPQIIFRVALLTALISYIVNRKRVRLSHLCLTVLTAILITHGKRFTPDFLIVNLPIVFFNLKETAKRVPLSSNAGYSHAWGHILAITLISILFVVGGVPATISGDRIDRMGFVVDKKFVPKNLVDFLDDNNIHGRVFNEMGIGGYLIFRRWPNELVFIDGRTPVYGDNFYHNFIDVFYRAANFEEMANHYNFDYMVFKADQAWNLRYFHKYIWENPQWKLIYAVPDEGLIYVRNISKYQDLITKFELKEHPIVGAMERMEKTKK